MLTCSERGSRVYLKDTVAGGGGDVLPGWLNYQGLSYAERLVVFLPVVRPVLFLYVCKLQAEIAVIAVGIVLLPALDEGAYRREGLGALRVVMDVQRDVRLYLAQPHQLVVYVVPV